MSKFSVIILLLVAVAQCLGRKKIICYIGTWAVYRPGDAKYELEKTDPFLCTHLVYSFAGLGSDNKIKSLDPWLDFCDGGGLCGYKKLVDLKKINPNLKVMLAIGGWNEGSAKYSQMASSRSSRATFINSCVEYVRQHGFDGLDLDWEYPSKRGGKPQDKNNFGVLVKEMRETFDQYGLLLSAAVSAAKATIVDAYDISALSRYLHFINLMMYDFHGGYDGVTHHHAPVGRHPSDTGDKKYLNAKSSVEYWISQGADPGKLILGIPLYGRSFTLSNPSSTGIGAPASNGLAGPHTKEAGFAAYNEICMWMKDPATNWKVTRDPAIVSPYAVYTYKGKKHWVGYDDEKSAVAKCDLIHEYRLGGAMVWSLEMDDFRGSCGKGKFPMMKSIKNALN